MDTVIRAAIVRNEIAQVLKSDRLNHIGSCEAHVFKLVDGTWEDLTVEPVLVHLLRDNLEGMTKMLAVHDHRLIINNVPVSSNFNVFTPSKKFLQFICNKYDKQTDNYGFGFASHNDMQAFLELLNKIKHAAMASLTPSFHPSLGLSQPPRNASYGLSPAFGVPLGFDASPVKAFTQANERHYEDNVHYNDDGNLSLSDADSLPISSSSTHQMNNNAPPFVPSVLPSDAVHSTHSLPLFAFAERRLCDMLSSFDAASHHHQNNESGDGDVVENPAGSIGSPIKKEHVDNEC